jgi:hypothetical protein
MADFTDNDSGAPESSQPVVVESASLQRKRRGGAAPAVIDAPQEPPTEPQEALPLGYGHPLPDRGPRATQWVLDALFGERASEAWVAVVRDVVNREQWAGGRYGDLSAALHAAGQSAHFVNTTIIRPQGKHRWDSLAESATFLFFDDCGDPDINPNAKMERDWLDVFGPTPTFVVETSEGNAQYFYAFAEPVKPDAYRRLIKMFKANPSTRGGFHEGAELTRYGRLPSGINVKPGRGGFETRLVAASGRKCTVKALIAAFNLKDDRPGPKATATGGSQEPTDGQDHKPERADLATLERLLMGDDAPLRNARVADYSTYFNILQWLHGATGGSEEGLALAIRWAADHPHKPGYDPESKWSTINAPYGGANSLWKLARMMDPVGTAKLGFDPIPDPPDPRAALLVSAWLKRDIPPRDFLLGHLMCTTSRWLIYGETGVGKSLLALDMAAAIAAGAPLLGWAGRRPARVMYLDGEMPAETFKERMQLIAERYGPDLQLYGYNRDDLDDEQMPPLNTPEGEQWLMREIDAVRPEVVFLDSIMCLLSGVMAEEESWGPVKHLVRKLTSKRIAQVWLHHTGHDGTKSFGTKTREWEMDTVLRLTFTDDAHEAFTMDFRKARLRTPATAVEFQSRTISLGPDGWTAEPMRGRPGTGRRSDDIIKIKRAIVDAYNRLVADENTTDAKVEIDRLRNEVKSRGWLDAKETGGLTSAARLSFHRAKTDLVASGRYAEADGRFWSLRPNSFSIVTEETEGGPDENNPY